MNEPQSPVQLQSEVNRLHLELAATKSAEDGEQIYVGNYLLERLAQLGVKEMFGVPGDFNLGFLDLVEDHPTIRWVGNCNELNAAYAADGYARIKEGLGVVTTTFGVGELSAMNGIAGAFSEIVPVLHLVGSPNTTQMKTHPILHHTLGDGRFDAYTKAATQFSIANGDLMNAVSAPAEIDRVLTEAITKARPVYLTLPTDIVYEKTSSVRLQTPLTNIPVPNDAEVEADVIAEIVEMVKEANGDVIILADACVIRHYVRHEVEELIEQTQFPVYTAPMGKTAVAETHPRYGGVYVGSCSHPDVMEKVENAKLILSIGGLRSDFNSGAFTYKIPANRTIELHSFTTKIRHAEYPGIGMKHMLPTLTKKLAQFRALGAAQAVPPVQNVLPADESDLITQEYLWPRVGNYFRPHDLVVGETGTSSFGLIDVKMPEGARFVTQVLWGSIGWATGSTLGVALAGKELKLGRTILFTGDGSIQLTVQELTPMLRDGLNVTVFVLNNKGYTIERCLHGKTRKYNDIVNWKWTSLLSTLGGEEGVNCRSYTVNTKKELDALLRDEEFNKADKMQLVEVMMDMFDAPRALKVQAEMLIKANKYSLS